MYAIDTRHLPPSQRVHPIWFLPMAVVMPVTYLLYTPLALFTLDSSSWETRGKAGRAAGQGSRLQAPGSSQSRERGEHTN
jgi:hypothetical protein